MFRVAVRRLARRVGTGAPTPASSSSGPRAVVAAPQAAVSADPWTEARDAQGQSYWWNKQTNETTAIGVPKPAWPDSWEEVKDASGQSYWWNKQTNQTTAVGAPKPSSLAAAPSQDVAPARGGLGAALADGLASGIGFSLAGRMMDGLLGPRQMEVVHRDESGSAAGGEAPPPGSDASGGGDVGSQGWSWGDAGQSSQEDAADDGGGDGGGGGWFGGGDGEW